MGTTSETNNITMLFSSINSCFISKVLRELLLKPWYGNHILVMFAKFGRDMWASKQSQTQLAKSILIISCTVLWSCHIWLMGFVTGKYGSKEYITKSFKLQKRALRLVSYSSYLCHKQMLFERLNTLNVFELYNKK